MEIALSVLIILAIYALSHAFGYVVVKLSRRFNEIPSWVFLAVFAIFCASYFLDIVIGRPEFSERMAVIFSLASFYMGLSKGDKSV